MSVRRNEQVKSICRLVREAGRDITYIYLYFTFLKCPFLMASWDRRSRGKKQICPRSKFTKTAKEFLEKRQDACQEEALFSGPSQQSPYQEGWGGVLASALMGWKDVGQRLEVSTKGG